MHLGLKGRLYPHPYDPIAEHPKPSLSWRQKVLRHMTVFVDRIEETRHFNSICALVLRSYESDQSKDTVWHVSLGRERLRASRRKRWSEDF